MAVTAFISLILIISAVCALHVRVRPVANSRLPALKSQADRPPKFDLFLAVALAGYSFQSYNEAPVTGKKAYGPDGTIITFTSPELINLAFSGVLLGTLRRGEFNKLQFEEQLLERLVTGDEPDSYVRIALRDTSPNANANANANPNANANANPNPNPNPNPYNTVS